MRVLLGRHVLGGQIPLQPVGRTLCAEQVKLGMAEAIRSSHHLEDAVEAYIVHSLTHPREYELYFTQPTLRPAESRTIEIGPGFVWVQAKCAERFGGSPEDHTQLVLAIWALAHGTITFLNSKVLPPQRAEELRKACRDAVATLLRNAERCENGSNVGRGNVRG